MRKFIERIAFYIRYEMTEEVKARIELGVLCGTLLIAFGVLGYGLYGLYRLDLQRAEQERDSTFKPEEEHDWDRDAAQGNL